MTERNESAIRAITKRYGPHLIAFLATIICAAFLIRRGDYYVSKWAVIAGVAVFLAAGMAALAATGRKCAWKTEVVFICYYALFGIATLLFVPPNSTPDFYSHYLRAYEIAHGHILTSIDPATSTGLLPQNLVLTGNSPELREIIAASGTTLDYSSEQAYFYGTDAVYSPITLLPASIGILLAEVFTSNALALITAARFMTWATTGAILFVSIRHMPFGKELLAFTAVLPMALELYTSVTTDVIVIAMAYALFAYAMHLRTTRKPASIALLALLVCVTSLEKIVYLPLCLLVLAIPAECFGSATRKRVAVGVLAAAAIALNIGWLLLVSDYASRPASINDGANSAEQVQYILAHPISLVGACVNATLMDGGEWVLQIMGGELNWLDARPAGLLPYALLVAHIAVCMRATDGEAVIDRNTRLLLGAVFLCTALLILASEYVYWTPVGLGTVLGVQGRYFAPLLPLLIAALLPGENAQWKPVLAWQAFFCITTLIFLAPLEIAL